VPAGLLGGSSGGLDLDASLSSTTRSTAHTLLPPEAEAEADTKLLLEQAPPGRRLMR